MGLGDVIGLNENVVNSSNATILDLLPVEMITKLNGLITILKITGIVIIAYIAFLIIRWILSIKRHGRIKKIYKRVKLIDAKLDLLLKRKDVKKLEEKTTEAKKIEKEGFFSRFKGKKTKKK